MILVSFLNCPHCPLPLLLVVGVATIDQHVFAVGGYDSTFQLPTVERYDTDTNQWEFIAPMNRPRSALSVAVVANKLYALGE